MPAPDRCYTLPEVLDKLQLPRRSFFELRKAGRLPCIEELRPRLGRRLRFRADLVDRYLAGQHHGPRAFRRSA